MRAIRALFGYLVSMSALTDDPSRDVKLPKLDAATRLLVTDEDLGKLLEAAERQRSGLQCVRDQASTTAAFPGTIGSEVRSYAQRKGNPHA
jgi:site-specific recombinase XerD